MDERDAGRQADSAFSPVSPYPGSFQNYYDTMSFVASNCMQDIEYTDRGISVQTEARNGLDTANPRSSQGLDISEGVVALSEGVTINVLGAPEPSVSRSFEVWDDNKADNIPESPAPAYQELGHHNGAFQEYRAEPETFWGSSAQPNSKQESMPDGQPLIQRFTSINEVPETFLPTQPSATRNVTVSRMYDVKPRGEVRFYATGMDYRESASERWLPAVYHYDLRQQYILQTITDEEYAFPDPPGTDPDDITSYLKDNKDWGPDWHQRPLILKRFARTNFPVPSYEPGALVDNGRVVIDQENHAVVAWRELPLCISSKVPGYKLEAWRRLNPRITIFDFLARMVKTDKPASSERNKLSMRMTRFRLKGACISWVEREGCSQIKEYMCNLIGSECVATNSTEDFGRDLTEVEIRQATAANRGRFPGRRRTKNKLKSLGQVPGSMQHPLAVDSDEEYGVVKIEDDEEEEDEGLRGPFAKRQRNKGHAVMVKDKGADGFRASIPRGPESTARSTVRSAANSTQPPQSEQNTLELGGEIRQLHRVVKHSNAASQSPAIASSRNGRRLANVARSSAAHGDFMRNSRQQHEASVQRNAQQPQAHHPALVQLDPRRMVPRNEAEADSIQQALRCTRNEFLSYYAEEAPLTDRRQCYAYQYEELRIAFILRWSFAGQAPQPTSVEDWGDTVFDWSYPARWLQPHDTSL